MKPIVCISIRLDSTMAGREDVHAPKKNSTSNEILRTILPVACGGGE